MTKEKNTKTPDIISAYMQYVLEHNAPPKNVYAFAKANDFEEADFYNQFGSFEAVERAIFNAFFDKTMALLEDSKEYNSFDAQNKLLTFYYTFFELLKANRSYVVHALSHHKNKLKVFSTLGGLRQRFKKFVENIQIETIDLEQKELEELKQKGVFEFTWGQLLFILKFWLDDMSPGFEKTDILIEKSITTGFDLLDTKPLKSLIDLGKFLFKEKMATEA